MNSEIEAMDGFERPCFESTREIIREGITDASFVTPSLIISLESTHFLKFFCLEHKSLLFSLLRTSGL